VVLKPYRPFVSLAVLSSKCLVVQFAVRLSRSCSQAAVMPIFWRSQTLRLGHSLAHTVLNSISTICMHRCKKLAAIQLPGCTFYVKREATVTVLSLFDDRPVVRSSPYPSILPQLDLPRPRHVQSHVVSGQLRHAHFCPGIAYAQCRRHPQQPSRTISAFCEACRAPHKPLYDSSYPPPIAQCSAPVIRRAAMERALWS
jgi:hypothetical protein